MHLGAAETISDGRPHRNPRRWVSVVVVGVACLVVVAVWGEDRWAQESREALTAASADAVTAESRGQAQVLGMISYAGSSLSSSSIDPSTRDDLRALVRDTAVTQAAVVRALTPAKPIPAYWRGDLHAQWQVTVSDIEERARELTEVAAYYR